MTGSGGCLTQLDSSLPEGAHFISGTGEIDPPLIDAHAGSICVDTPGGDRCEMGPYPRAVCCRDSGGCDGLFWRCNDGTVLWQLPCEYCQTVWQGACCHLHGGCTYMTSEDCYDAAGDFHVGQTCEEVKCVDAVDSTTWGRIKSMHR